MTIQLATRIDPEKKRILDKIHKKTHISIRVLTEKAITLLDDYYTKLQNSYTDDIVDDNFAELLNHSMKKYDSTYKKLAE